MGIKLRGPSGGVFAVDVTRECTRIDLSTTGEAAGQWIAYTADPGVRLYAGMRNGQPMERVVDNLVFACGLNETGEEYCAFMSGFGLSLVRLVLSTSKLPLAYLYSLLAEYQRLFGGPPIGASSVSGIKTNSSRGRPPTDLERAYDLVLLAFDVLRCCPSLRADIGKHERGTQGSAGIDAAETLAAWKRYPTWYKAATPTSTVAVRCGAALHVEPLRTVPRQSPGGNRFLGAVVSKISDLVRSLPVTTGGRMAAGLLQAAKRTVAILDLIEVVTGKEADQVLSATDLPPSSARFAHTLNEIEAVLRRPSRIEIGPDGRMPHALPGAELVFQKAAVAAALLALGAAPEELEGIFHGAKTVDGGVVGDRFTVWVDTSRHGLPGWRSDTALPADYRPDLLVKRNRDNKWLLLDAKLRAGESEKGLLSKSGVKELQAYMQEYNLKQGILAVPGQTPTGWDHEDICGQNFRIRAVAVPTASFVDTARSATALLDDMWN